jgi:drug/metabolite transporter (DMT)-like permease
MRNQEGGDAMSPRVSAPVLPRSDRVGWIALIVGSGIIAWSGVLARFLDVGPLAGAAWRMGLAVPVLAIWAGIGARGRAAPQDLARFALPLLLAGLAFAMDVGSFHIALTGTKVANASFIGNVAPILAVVGGALFFREHPAARVWPALGLALFGSWVMAGMAAPAHIGYGDAFALSAAASYATYLMFIKLARSGLDGATATLGSAAVSAVALTLAAWLHGEKMIPTSPLGWVIVVLLGVVSHAMGQGLTSVAIGRISVGVVALVILAQPPFSALIAWLVLHETMTPLQMAGGAIILAAVFLARPR